MQTDSLNGRIGLFGLLTTLLMLYTQADDAISTNSQYQKGDFELSLSVPFGDPDAGPSDNLFGSHGAKIESSWPTDNAGLKLNSNPQDGNTESPLLADASMACPNHSRLKQSRRGKRDEKEQTICKWPYSGPTTTTTPKAQGDAPEEEIPSPWRQQEGRPWPKLILGTNWELLWLQLRSAKGVEAEANFKVCNGNGLFPVCSPANVPGVPQLESRAIIVEPCRFWFQYEMCDLDLEVLWCCQYAKERPIDEVLSNSLSASTFAFDMKYRGAGLQCYTLKDAIVRNFGLTYKM